MKLGRARIGDRVVFGEVEADTFHVLDGDPFSGRKRSGESVSLGEVVPQAPTQPRTVLLILGGFLPGPGSSLPPGTQPRLTPKITADVSGDGAEIIVPAFVTAPLWIEVELAVVIGREIHNVNRDEARAAILGYTCFNHASAAEFIFDVVEKKPLATSDYFRAKSVDTFASMGPWIETDLTEEDLARGLQLTAQVNGELKAEGNTRLAKFPPSEVVRFASESITLYPGDVIALGTPQPCDAGPGDVVQVEVEGIGSFTNTIVSASSR